MTVGNFIVVLILCIENFVCGYLIGKNKEKIMTEEQIKQKAEEYAEVPFASKGDKNLMSMAFIDGYKECQKEHEWHYCKDELPDHNGQFYVALKGHTETFILNYDYDEYDESKMGWLDDDDTNFDDEVYAWREKLKAPKEIE